MKTFIAGTFTVLALTFVAAPAFASDYFVVQDSASMKCSVVQTKPTVATTSVIGIATGYSTQADADAAMAKVTTCKS